MSIEFRLADIGEGLDEAEIVEWKVSVGDRVVRDQPLVEVLTDKSQAELPAPADGTIVELAGAVGDIIEVGAVLAVIAPSVGDDSPPAGVIEPPSSPPTDTPVAELRADGSSPAPVAAAGTRIKASPSTRREAARRGIDLSTVAGSGPGGRILASDLDSAIGLAEVPERTADTPDLPPEPVLKPSAPSVMEPAMTARAPRPSSPQGPTPNTERVDSAAAGAAAPEAAVGPQTGIERRDRVASTPLRGVRRQIARNMTASWTAIPHIHVFDEIDARALLRLRNDLRDTGRPALTSLTPLSFFVAAVASALRSHPVANASIDLDAETIAQHDSVDVGIAVASERGLVVPVVAQADQLGFEDLVMAVGDAVEGARTDSLSPDAYRDGTTTITNFGSLGARQATPIIRAPESTIFGFGSITERPWVEAGVVIAVPTLPIVIGADHRIIDGDLASALLGHVAAALTTPSGLLLGP